MLAAFIYLGVGVGMLYAFGVVIQCAFFAVLYAIMGATRLAAVCIAAVRRSFARRAYTAP